MSAVRTSQGHRARTGETRLETKSLSMMPTYSPSQILPHPLWLPPYCPKAGDLIFSYISRPHPSLCPPRSPSCPWLSTCWLQWLVLRTLQELAAAVPLHLFSLPEALLASHMAHSNSLKHLSFLWLTLAELPLLVSFSINFPFAALATFLISCLRDCGSWGSCVPSTRL